MENRRDMKIEAKKEMFKKSQMATVNQNLNLSTCRGATFQLTDSVKGADGSYV